MGTRHAKQGAGDPDVWSASDWREPPSPFSYGLVFATASRRNWDLPAFARRMASAAPIGQLPAIRLQTHSHPSLM